MLRHGHVLGEFRRWYVIFFFQAEDGMRDLVRSRGLGDVYKRQLEGSWARAASPSGSRGSLRRLAALISALRRACEDMSRAGNRGQYDVAPTISASLRDQPCAFDPGAQRRQRAARACSSQARDQAAGAWLWGSPELAAARRCTRIRSSTRGRQPPQLVPAPQARPPSSPLSAPASQASRHLPWPTLWQVQARPEPSTAHLTKLKSL